jgi:hypothetical protein
MVQYDIECRNLSKFLSIHRLICGKHIHFFNKSLRQDLQLTKFVRTYYQKEEEEENKT